MKKNFWTVLAAMLSATVLAQPATNDSGSAGTGVGSPAIATPAPAPAVTNAPQVSATASSSIKTNAPAVKSSKKKSAKNSGKKPAVKKSAAAELRTVPLVAGAATVIASNVNVRGQAKLNSEVIARLQKEQPVTVLEEVHLKKSGPDEPSAWAKIILPDTAKVWVNAKYIDSTNQTVIPKKLKLRGGPGENYSFLGVLKQGDSVKVITNRNDWLQIQAPAEASGFVAAQYLKQDTNAPVEVAATTPATTVPETPTVAPATEPVVTAPESATNAPADTNLVAAATTEPATNATPAAAEEPPKPRIVQREGVVRGTFSIQAPTSYELISMDTHRAINYLHAESPTLDLSRYKGMHIIVTGEEGLDERWHNTPVITIQRIQVLD
jgi:uncharacterized protein YgiM (DUF1202 family)